MARDEPVTSPDQHRPMVSRRVARTGAVVIILILLAMARFGNHEGQIENLFLYGFAGLLALMILADIVLPRRGLRS